MNVGIKKDENGKITRIEFVGGGTAEEKEKIYKELMEEEED